MSKKEKVNHIVYDIANTMFQPARTKIFVSLQEMKEIKTKSGVILPTTIINNGVNTHKEKVKTKYRLIVLKVGLDVNEILKFGFDLMPGDEIVIGDHEDKSGITFPTFDDPLNGSKIYIVDQSEIVGAVSYLKIKEMIEKAEIEVNEIDAVS